METWSHWVRTLLLINLLVWIAFCVGVRFLRWSVECAQLTGLRTSQSSIFKVLSFARGGVNLGLFWAIRRRPLLLIPSLCFLLLWDISFLLAKRSLVVLWLSFPFLFFSLSRLLSSLPPSLFSLSLFPSSLSSPLPPSLFLPLLNTLKDLPNP